MSKQGPVVGVYNVYSANGRFIRKASKVSFPDGRVIKFVDRVSKRYAIWASGNIINIPQKAANP